MAKKLIYWPVTPKGTCLAHLEGKTEEEAWQKLLAEAVRAGTAYKTIDDLKKRGYEVVDLEDV